jgi:hypothetical protein
VLVDDDDDCESLGVSRNSQLRLGMVFKLIESLRKLSVFAEWLLLLLLLLLMLVFWFEKDVEELGLFADGFESGSFDTAGCCCCCSCCV